MLFEKAAKVARAAYDTLLADAPATSVENLDDESRDAWVKSLRKFSREWKGSPAALAAKLEAKEWKVGPLN